MAKDNNKKNKNKKTLDEKQEKAKKEKRHWKNVAEKKDSKARELHERLDELRKEKKHHKERMDEVKGEENKEKHADELDEIQAEIDWILETIPEKQKQEKEAKKHYEHWDDRLHELQEKEKKKKQQKKEKEGQITKHFHVSEFDCNNGAAVPKNAYDALEHWCKNYGEPLRDKFGAVHINSGYRTASYNASIGGASDSVHIYDNHPNAVAADFWCDKGNPNDWAAFLSQKADGLGTYSTFVHADNRNRIGWSDARWYG
jgi:uncharacterized protein YcbK (DUF882 family)